MKKITAQLLALCLLLSFAVSSAADIASADAALSEDGRDIVILFTSDVHSGIDSGWTYSGVDVIRSQLIAKGNHVTLVDNGDAVQGEPLAALTAGGAII